MIRRICRLALSRPRAGMNLSGFNDNCIRLSLNIKFTMHCSNKEFSPNGAANERFLQYMPLTLPVEAATQVFSSNVFFQ